MKHMTKKELECLGMALDALLEANMIEEVRRIVKRMAGEDKEEEK